MVILRHIGFIVGSSLLKHHEILMETVSSVLTPNGPHTMSFASPYSIAGVFIRNVIICLHRGEGWRIGSAVLCNRSCNLSQASSSTRLPNIDRILELYVVVIRLESVAPKVLLLSFASSLHRRLVLDTTVLCFRNVEFRFADSQRCIQGDFNLQDHL